MENRRPEDWSVTRFSPLYGLLETETMAVAGIRRYLCRAVKV